MLSKKEIERYRRRLLALQKHLSKDVAELEEEAMHPVGGENSGNLSDVPVHPADLGTDNFEEYLEWNANYRIGAERPGRPQKAAVAVPQ
jgi:hypothetical protein